LTCKDQKGPARIAPDPFVMKSRLVSAWLNTLLCSFIATATLASTPELSEYRLSGTINDGDSKRLALVEAPGGERKLLRIGDRLAGAGVLEIDDDMILLEKNGKLLTLGLEGLLAIGQTRNPVFQTNIVATAAMRAKLESMVVGGTGRSRSSGSKTIAEQMRTILNLPPQAKIVTINDRPVTSPEQGLSVLNESLGSGGGIIRIEISGVPESDALYLMPEDETGNAS